MSDFAYLGDPGGSEKAMPSYAPWDVEAARAIIADKRSMPGALLPILHALQEEFGYIDREAEPLIAEILNLSRAEVHGVVTFYHDFRQKPAGRHVLRLCRAESCQARGSDALAAWAEARLGIASGATTADGNVTLEPVYCLGLCSVSPSAMFDGKIVGRLDEKKLDALLAEADR
jgi:formate dehydrogenase subunit gamma